MLRCEHQQQDLSRPANAVRFDKKVVDFLTASFYVNKKSDMVSGEDAVIEMQEKVGEDEFPHFVYFELLTPKQCTG